MSEQNPTVKIDGYGYVDMAPTVTEAMVQSSVNRERVSLRFGPSNHSFISVSLPHSAWVQIIPLLVDALPEPSRSQAIAAVDQFRAEVNVIPQTLTERLDAARNGQEFGAALLGFMSTVDAARDGSESDQ